MQNLEQEKNKPLALVLFYVALLAVTFSTDTTLPKIASMVVIPVALAYLLISADFTRLVAIKKVFLIWITYLLVLMSFSLLLWILNTESAHYIFRGLTKLSYLLINIFVAIGAVYLFRQNAVEYTLYGACIINLIIMARAFLSVGPAQAFRDVLYFFTSLGTQEGFMRLIEIHDLTYVFGLFFLYYVFLFRGNKKKRIFCALLSFFFFFSGFKRIALLAILAAVVVGLILQKTEKKQALCLFVGSMVALSCFLYIPIVKFGYFDKITTALNIDTNTRSNVYDYINPTYEFSMSYRGQGFDYVVRFLADLKEAGQRMNGVGILKLHNDILVQYIELGFWGFIFWLCFNCIFMQHWWGKHFGSRVAMIYCICTLYSFINYTTGNTAYSYPVVLVFRIIMLSSIYFAEKKETAVPVATEDAFEVLE